MNGFVIFQLGLATFNLIMFTLNTAIGNAEGAAYALVAFIFTLISAAFLYETRDNDES